MPRFYEHYFPGSWIQNYIFDLWHWIVVFATVFSSFLCVSQLTPYSNADDNRITFLQSSGWSSWSIILIPQKKCGSASMRTRDNRKLFFSISTVRLVCMYSYSIQEDFIHLIGQYPAKLLSILNGWANVTGCEPNGLTVLYSEHNVDIDFYSQISHVSLIFYVNISAFKTNR